MHSSSPDPPPEEQTSCDRLRLSTPFLLATVDALVSSEKHLEIDSLGEEGPEALDYIQISTESLTTLGIGNDNCLIEGHQELKLHADKMSTLGLNALTEFERAVKDRDSKTCCIQARLVRAAIYQQLAIHPLIVDQSLLNRAVTSFELANQFLAQAGSNLDHRANVAVRHRSLRCMQEAFEQFEDHTCEGFMAVFSAASQRSLKRVTDCQPEMRQELRSLVDGVVEQGGSCSDDNNPLNLQQRII